MLKKALLHIYEDVKNIVNGCMLMDGTLEIEYVRRVNFWHLTWVHIKIDNLLI